MKKIVALILSLCLAMSMLAFASADAETKTGSAQGLASEVKVEMTGEVFTSTDSLGEMQRLQKYITDQIKSVVGIKVKTTIVPPKTLPRSEGKAKRVVDNRKL